MAAAVMNVNGSTAVELCHLYKYKENLFLINSYCISSHIPRIRLLGRIESRHGTNNSQHCRGRFRAHGQATCSHTTLPNTKGKSKLTWNPPAAVGPGH